MITAVMRDYGITNPLAESLMIDRWDPLQVVTPGSPAQSGVSVLSSRTLEERQYMARLKQHDEVDKKNVAEYLITHLRGDLRLPGQE